MATRPRKLDAVKILPGVIQRLLAIQHPDDMLPEVLSLCRTLLNADEVSLLTLSSDGKHLVEQTVVGTKLRPAQKGVRIGVEGVTGWVASHRKALVVPDVRKDRRYIRVDPRRRSEAAVPIVSEDRLLGVLNFESNHTGFFKKSDVGLLEFLAAQLAIALGVAQIHETENSLRDRLAMLHHLSRLSGGFLPTDQYLLRAADVTCRTLGCYFVGVFQGDYERHEVVLLAQASAEAVPIRIGERQRFGEGLIGKSFELGEIINARDVSKEPSYLPVLGAVRSEACVPIRIGDHCLGILDAQATSLAAFNGDDMMALETMARFLVPPLQIQKASGT